VYKSVVADEYAYVVDAAPFCLKKDQVAGLEFTALDFFPYGRHLPRRTGQSHAENPIVHEANKTGAVEPFGSLAAETISDTEKLFDIAEEVPHGTG